MKRISSIVLFVLLFSLSSVPVVATPGFSDLQPHHSFYEEIVFLENEGFINGYPDQTFRPDREVTRAEAAIMLGKTFELNGEQRESSFSDVSAGHKASGYIEAAVAQGFIQGFPNGTYRPDETVTRGQMAILLSRAFKLKEEANIPFSDVSPSMSSYLHIKRIVAANITQGYPNNTYRPDGKVTRGQFSAFLARALNDQFKVQLPVRYTKDINKTFIYETKEFGEVRYQYSDNYEWDWNLWYVYDDRSIVTAMVESQDEEGYKMGPPNSEYTLLLKHPIKDRHRWDFEYGGDVVATYEILTTDMTLTTPAGTFEDVVKVTNLEGWEGYFAPNMGIIKEVWNGEIIEELIAVEE